MVDVVSAEKLVRTFAGQDYFNVLARYLRDKVQRYARSVRERLVHVVLYLADIAPVFVRGYNFVMMFEAYLFRELFCVAYLVVLFVCAKADGKCFLPRKIC